MGERGPVGKRDAEKLGHRTKAERHQQAPSASPVPVPQPPPDPSWGTRAMDWYRSLAWSGQARFYEPSDWELARIIAEQIHRELGDKFLGMGENGPIYGQAPMSGQALSSILKAMTGLMVSEGDRRRHGLELTRAGNDAKEDAKVLSIVRDDEDAAFG